MDESLHLYCIYHYGFYSLLSKSLYPACSIIRFLEYIFPAFEMGLLIIRRKTDGDSANFFILIHTSTRVELVKCQIVPLRRV